MLSLATTLVALPLLASAHMSPWLPSMYGVGPNFAYSAGNPVDPIGPGWTMFDDWWFRGPSYRALKPQSNVASQLPAGGSFTMEIACHVAWTSYGYATTTPGSELDACPGPNAGPYHSGDPNSQEIEEDLVSGCALAIADVENIEDVTMDNLVVFSTQQNCVRTKETTFEIPAKMPKCTGSNCICSWHWLANNGTANYYQTGFNCTITGADPLATPIAPPSDPVFCKGDPSSCTKGAKRPIYAYNYPSNVPWIGNNDRAGYHASWSFPNDGAQNDIFLAAGQVVNATLKGNTTTETNPWFGTPTGAGGAPDLGLSVSGATASSAGFGQGPYHAVDGWVDGYKEDGSGNYEQEWASNGEKVGAWLNLVWNSPVTFNQLVLFDRPNLDDQVTAANITFSDGSFVPVGTLFNDGTATYLNLSSSVTTTSLHFAVTGVSASTGNVGLSEIEIFLVPTSGFTTTTPVQGVAQVVSSAIPSSTASSAAVSSTAVVQNATSTSVLLNSTVAASSSTSASLNSTVAVPVPTSIAANSTSALPSSTVAPISSALPSSTVVSSSAPTSLPSSSLPLSSTTIKASSVASNTSTQASSTVSSASSTVSSSAQISSTGSTVSPIQAIPVSASSSPSATLSSTASSSTVSTVSSTGSTSTSVSSTQISSSATSTQSSVSTASKISTTQSSTIVSSSLASTASASSSSSKITTTTQVASTLSSVSSSVKPSTTTTTTTAAAPSATLVDLALLAVTTASSQTYWSGSLAKGAIDGIIGGYLPGGSYLNTQEWASTAQKAGAWLQLNWVLPQSFNQIVLWDRPNLADQILAGNITFADGTGVSFGALPNDAKTGLTLNFANTITTTSLRLYISQASASTINSGLSEIQVYNADASKFAAGSKLVPTKAVAAVVSTSTSVAASTSSSKVSSTSTAPVWRLVPTGIVHNPKSVAAPNEVASSTTTTAAPKATTSAAASSSSKTTVAATTTSSRLVWTRVTDAARAILAQPAWKRDAAGGFEDGAAYSSNGTVRHVRDFRLITE
ncbi:hypothetical protein JCM11491_004076 [Sporobolomyces phaffii]